MQDIKQTFKELGLDESEVDLYLASLKLGEAGMSELAREAQIKRTSAYVVFQALEKKGLMGSFKLRGGLKFVATAPDILLQKTQKHTEDLRNLLPELNGLAHKKDHRPQITYYEGKEGYFIASGDSLRQPNSTVRHIGSISEIHKVIGEEWDLNYYIPERLKKHIHFKALYFQSQMPQSFLSANHAELLREVKYLPENFIYNTSKLIYGNKMAIFSSKKELVTVIIESPDIATSETKIFETIWNTKTA
ncbi:MAG: helix-turn-helix domain-containing protein [Candidatus Doudnabacteria bacterium]|nr:helix-turn-helix domain-containing protein [Candidatus Doudnabacteria bacterium]